MDYSTMEAGREMDELITTKIISDDGFWHGVKPYSTDIAAAWEVVEKLDAECELHTKCKFRDYPNTPYGFKISKNGMVYFMLADTAPLAICRAALMAVNT